MNDYFGRELEIGQEVLRVQARGNSVYMYQGVIIEFSPCKARVQRNNNTDSKGSLVQGNRLVII